MDKHTLQLWNSARMNGWFIENHFIFFLKNKTIINKDKALFKFECSQIKLWSGWLASTKSSSQHIEYSSMCQYSSAFFSHTLHSQNIDCKSILRVMIVFHHIFGQQNLAGPSQVLNKEIHQKANLRIISGLPVVGWVVLSLAVSRLMEARLSEENKSTNLQPLDHSFRHILHLQCTERKKA